MQASTKAAVFRLHGDCEVAGLAEEGFPNSWWAATVEAINSNHTIKVKYRDVSDAKHAGSLLHRGTSAPCIHYFAAHRWWQHNDPDPRLHPGRC